MIHDVLSNVPAPSCTVLPFPSTGTVACDRALFETVKAAVGASNSAVAVKTVNVPPEYCGRELFDPVTQFQALFVQREEPRLDTTAHKLAVNALADKAATLVSHSRRALSRLCSWVRRCVLPLARLTVDETWDDETAETVSQTAHERSGFLPGLGGPGLLTRWTREQAGGARTTTTREGALRR